MRRRQLKWLPARLKQLFTMSSLTREIDPLFGEPRPRLFVPRLSRATGRLELSVRWSEGMAESEIWAICAEHLDPVLPDLPVARSMQTCLAGAPAVLWMKKTKRRNA
jgi:hypothetical protein